MNGRLSGSPSTFESKLKCSSKLKGHFRPHLQVEGEERYRTTSSLLRMQDWLGLRREGGKEKGGREGGREEKRERGKCDDRTQ